MTSSGPRAPAGKSVGDIAGIAEGAASSVQVIGIVASGAAIVDSGRAVVLADVLDIGLLQTLHQSIARSRALGAVLDHLLNLRVRARVLDHAAGVAGAGAGVVLHETGVLDRPRGRDDAHAAVGFLHDDCEDEAGVDARRGRDFVDGRLDVGDFVVRVVGAPAVVGARLLHDGRVGGEPVGRWVSRWKKEKGGENKYMVSKSTHWSWDGQPAATVPLPVYMVYEDETTAVEVAALVETLVED